MLLQLHLDTPILLHFSYSFAIYLPHSPFIPFTPSSHLLNSSYIHRRPPSNHLCTNVLLVVVAGALVTVVVFVAGVTVTVLLIVLVLVTTFDTVLVLTSLVIVRT